MSGGGPVTSTGTLWRGTRPENTLRYLQVVSVGTPTGRLRTEPPLWDRRRGGGGDGCRPGHLYSYLHEVAGPQVPRLKTPLLGPSTRPRRPSGELDFIYISTLLFLLPTACGKSCCHTVVEICSEIRKRGAHLRRALLPGSCKRTWLWLAGQGGKKGLRGWCSDLTSPPSLRGRGRHLQGAPNLGRDVCCYWWGKSLHGEERPGGQKTVVPNALWRLPRSRHTTGRQQGWRRAQGDKAMGQGPRWSLAGGPPAVLDHGTQAPAVARAGLCCSPAIEPGDIADKVGKTSYSP